MQKHLRKFERSRMSLLSTPEEWLWIGVKRFPPSWTPTKRSLAALSLCTISALSGCASKPPIVLQAPCPPIHFPQELLQDSPTEYLLDVKSDSPNSKENAPKPPPATKP